MLTIIEPDADDLLGSSIQWREADARSRNGQCTRSVALNGAFNSVDLSGSLLLEQFVHVLRTSKPEPRDSCWGVDDAVVEFDTKRVSFLHLKTRETRSKRSHRGTMRMLIFI